LKTPIIIAPKLIPGICKAILSPPPKLVHPEIVGKAMKLVGCCKNSAPRFKKSLRKFCDFCKPLKVICPSGCFLSSPLKKNISVFPNPNQFYNSRRLVPAGGALAIVTDVGNGMRWTRTARLTNRADADGEVVWS
jgi:hypothetical protein